jgi:hypothetical protein
MSRKGIDFIVNNVFTGIGFKVHPKGVCMVIEERNPNDEDDIPLSTIHIELDLRELTLLCAEINQVIFELQGYEEDDETNDHA